MTPRSCGLAGRQLSAPRERSLVVWTLLPLGAVLVGCDRAPSPHSPVAPAASSPAIVVRLADDAQSTRAVAAALELGAVRAGESLRGSVNLQNTSATAQTIDRWVTSCECLDLGETPLVLPPGDERQIVLAIDGESLAEFRGTLAIEVVGYHADRPIVSFEARIDVEGESPPSAADALEPIPAADSDPR